MLIRLLIMVVWVGGCAAEVPGGAGSHPAPAGDGPDGRLDNYRSPVGREFAVKGVFEVTLEAEAPGEGEGQGQDAALAELSRAGTERLTTGLRGKLNELWPSTRRVLEKDIVVMLRAGTPRAEPVGEASAFQFEYFAEVAGPSDLLERLPLDELEGGRGLRIALNDTQDVDLIFSEVERSLDAYPQYADMFADGRLDIGILVGGDHFSPRNDLREAEAVYDELIDLGLTSPVDTFQELTLDSSTFTGLLEVNLPGPAARQSVELRVRLVYADMGSAEELVDVYKAMARDADVVVYRGHAGTSLSYSGVVVQYTPARVAIAATQFRELDLPERYQVFVFDGCETYTGYADQLYAHPLKHPGNADVITSVNYGSGLREAETVRALVRALLAKRDDQWFPHSWDGLLAPINDATRGRWTPIYGVHGLDDNPRLSPLADVTTIGQVCTQQADCPGVDNLCVRRADGAMRCAAACTASSACPAGTTCRRVRAPNLGDPYQCL